MNYKPQTFANYVVFNYRGVVMATAHFPLAHPGFVFGQSFRNADGQVRVNIPGDSGQARLTSEKAVVDAFEFSNRDCEVTATSGYEYDLASGIETYEIHFKALDAACQVIEEVISVEVRGYQNAERAIIWDDFTHSTQIGIIYADGKASVNNLSEVVKSLPQAA